jgi:rod shape-determining protein MreC
MLLEWLIRNRNVVVPLGLFLASLVLLSFESYDQRNKRMSIFSRTVLDVIGLGQRTVTGVARGVRNSVDRYIWLRGVEQENEALRRKIEKLNRDRDLLREQAIENERLRRLLHFKPMEEIKDWIPAQVTGESSPGAPKTIKIDKGSLHGIRPRMAVVTYDGALVGQILDEPGSSIGQISSHVLLITDLRSKVNVVVQRPDSRTRGLMVGRPEYDDCVLDLYSDRPFDIKVGDLLITSGFGGVFKKGWPVGLVKEIASDPSSYSPRISVEPVADFFTMEEVIVIVPLEEGE